LHFPSAFGSPLSAFHVSKTRTFIAVEAVDEAHAAALAAIDRLRSAADGVKWVAPDNLHWTIQFLGDLDDREMAEVCLRTVRVAARHEPFELSAVGVGAFPSIQRPRTLWIGAGEGGEEFLALQADVEASMRQLGFRGEGRAFTPHLTIGRAGRGGHAGPLLTERLAKLADFDGGRMSVEEVVVFASELDRDGPVYTVLARAPLGGRT
jgi:2'-5' RNA ligase